MLNCAHPTHFEPVLKAGDPSLGRLRGLRANASRLSHAALNEATTLDVGDPEELGRQYAALAVRLPALSVFGGCCGTDHRHVEQVAVACAPVVRGRPALGR
jgi:S-methylmethionine-dependent homocysteine/selenocysteine methylase